jgi:protein O-mannosyl-transferase
MRPGPTGPRPQGAGEIKRSRRSPSGGGEGLASGPVHRVSRRFGRRLVVCIFLVLAVAAVFGKTVSYDFVNFDDDVVVYQNPIVTHGVTMHGVARAFTKSVEGMWYPLTLLSYMLDSQLYGTKPWGYHLTNVVLHAATAVALFLVLRKMTGDFLATALVALLFAVHPLRAEAVAWVGERKSPLSGLFFVLTIAAYVAFARRPFSLARYLLVMALFALGLLAKPTLVPTPFVLLLLDYWPLQRWRGAGMGRWGDGEMERWGDAQAKTRRRGVQSTEDQPSSLVVLFLEKVPLLLLSVACSFTAVLSRGTYLATLKSVPISARIANVLVSYVVYLGQLFWPVELAAFYPRPDSVPAWQVAGAIVVLTAVSVAALVMAWRRQPAVLVGWLWYLVMLLPVIGVVPIGDHVRADRYTYLPDIGLCIALVWGVQGAVRQLWGDSPSVRWLARGAAIVFVAGIAACAWQQTSYWRNSETLWTRALACTSNNLIACNNLGQALVDRGQVDDGLEQYRQALEIDPASAIVYCNIGDIFARREQWDAAAAQYREALKLSPDMPRVHYLLGKLASRTGRTDDAIAHFSDAVKIDPEFAAAQYDLGLALARREEFGEAAALFEKAVEINPFYVEAYNNLGISQVRLAHFDEALFYFRKALEIKPDFAEARINLGDALGRLGKADEARDEYQKALALASARNDSAMAEAVRNRIKSLAPAAPGGP